MPAEKEEQKVFQSMNDYLEQISKKVCRIDDAVVSDVEKKLEDRRAQKIRDKVQEDQRDALDRIAAGSGQNTSTTKKETKKSDFRWGKLLVGATAMGALAKLGKDWFDSKKNAIAMIPTKIYENIAKRIPPPVKKILKSLNTFDEVGGGGSLTPMASRVITTTVPKVQQVVKKVINKAGKVFTNFKQPTKILPTKVPLNLPDTKMRTAPASMSDQQLKKAGWKVIKPKTTATRVVPTKTGLFDNLKPAANDYDVEMQKTKKKMRQTLNKGMKIGSKAWRIWRVTAAATAAMGPYVGIATMMGMTALEVWAETDSGKAILAENKVTIDEVGKEIYGKLFTPMKKAKNLATGGLIKNPGEVPITPTNPLRPSTDAATRLQVKKMQKQELPWYKTAQNFLFGDKAEGKGGAERINDSVKRMVDINPAMGDLMHISGSAFSDMGQKMRVTSAYRNRAAQRKAMENQRKNDPAQYKKNYSLGGTLTPSDTSTETWLNKRMSKHQHGNAIDVGYPEGIKGNTPKAIAFVASINNKLMSAGFDGNAVGEGNHIHMSTGATPSLKEAKVFENLFNKSAQGANLKSLHNNGASTQNGSTPVIINNVTNQSSNVSSNSVMLPMAIRKELP
jgi:hypothetical protein